MRFDDDKYVKDFVAYGIFPKIHDNIIDTVSMVSCDVAIDLGSCTGLLSARLIENGYKRVIGIEGNPAYLKKAVKHSGVTYSNFYITEENLGKLETLLDTHKVEMIVARRVFPEICDTGGLDLVKRLAVIFDKHKVKFITIEGRIDSKNAVNKLHNIDSEVKMFNGYYDEYVAHKNCRILKRKTL